MKKEMFRAERLVNNLLTDIGRYEPSLEFYCVADSRAGFPHPRILGIVGIGHRIGARNF